MAKKNLLKRAAAAGAALLASAGLLLNGMFADPAEIAEKNAYVQAPIITAVDTQAEAEEEETDTEDKRDKKTFFSRIRAWILHLPLGVRVFIGIPLWAVGWALSELFGFLMSTFITPNAAAIIRWLVILAVIAGIAILAARVLFPGKKLKDVINRRNFSVLTVGVLVMAVLNGLVPFVWEGYDRYGRWFRLGTGALIVTAVLISVMIPKKEKA